MIRTKPSLHQHLLTRSDLAQLQVPASDILSWLASGAIEQVGDLPDGGAGDPVFAVLSNRLRQDLALRLLAIGKPTVLLTPLRVRSFLLRAMLAQPAAGNTRALGDDPSGSSADREQELADVLHEVAAEVEADVREVLRLAAEEAVAPADDPAIDLMAMQPSPGTADATELLASEVEECFDADDLANSLDDLEPAVLHTAASGEATPGAPASTPAPTTPMPISTSDESARSETEAIEAAAGATPTHAPAASTAGGEAPGSELAPAPAKPQPGAAGATATPVGIDNASSQPSAAQAAAATPGGTASDEGREIATAATSTLAGAVPDATPAPGAPADPQGLESIEAMLCQLQQTLLDLARQPTSPVPGARGDEPGASPATPRAQEVAPPPPRPSAADRDAVVGQLAAHVPVAHPHRVPIVLLAVTGLVIAGSIAFWQTAGSLQFALGTLVGANLVGGCVLATSRSRR